MLVTNSTCIKTENHYWLLILSLGDSVAEGTVSESKCHFQHWQDKRHLQTPQKTPNEQKLEYSKKQDLWVIQWNDENE